ncbi:hypothetical protein J3Q64DRAFT_1844157 [Phycomyces blakesleeanus]|uniref:Uncharacterized protein n=1 Tax=Phycomyces blakesleeanus TaxID=4837 RepID=A0ABR3BDR7_PHYBL
MASVHLMNKRHIVVRALLFFFLFLFTPVESSYLIPSKYIKLVNNRYATASFVRNNALYTYGGESSLFNTSSFFTSMSLSPKDKSLIIETVPQSKPGPSCSYSAAVLLDDNQTVILFVGQAFNLSANSSMPIYTYSFLDPNPMWKEIKPVGNALWPDIRIGFSATLAPNGKIYVFGGVRIDTISPAMPFFSFDPRTHQIEIPSSPGDVQLYGHTGTMLPTTSTVEGYFLGNQFVIVYNTNNDTWAKIRLTSETDELRMEGNSVLGPDQKTIFTFGGSGYSGSPNMTIFNTIVLLDTSTWTTSLASTRGALPVPRSLCSLGFIADDLLMISYGIVFGITSDIVNVLQIETKKTKDYLWLIDSSDIINYIHPDDQDRFGLSGRAIAGIVVGVLAFVIIVTLLFKRPRKFVSTVLLISTRRTLWNKRLGEPIWTELCRLGCRVILLLIFALFMVYLIWQVMTSGISTIEIHEYSSIVQSPDIRICLDGWDGSDTFDIYNIRYSCITDSGYICDEYVTLLDMEIHQPRFSYEGSAKVCILFSPPEEFGLSPTRDGDSKGTRFAISLVTQINFTSGFYATVYPPKMNPNNVLYNITTTNNQTQLLTEDAINEWIINDSGTVRDSNTYFIPAGVSSTVEYQIQDHQYLQPAGWNNVGFLPLLNHTPEVVIKYGEGNSDRLLDIAGYTVLATLEVFPSQFAKVVLEEKRIYTLLDALGTLGGFFSLGAAAQIWLFGFRPSSPWGIVHRWSVGSMRRSIKRNLRTQFDSLNTSVPLATPVIPRFTAFSLGKDVNEDEYEYEYKYQEKEEELRASKEAQVPFIENSGASDGGNQNYRMEHMERRVQLLEKLFKSYYVDDEIFTELDLAIKQDNLEKYPKTAGGDSGNKNGTGGGNGSGSGNEHLNETFKGGYEN